MTEILISVALAGVKIKVVKEGSTSMKEPEKQVVSKKRVTEHGEVYTSEREVNVMLDLVKQETERIDSRFLEPSCGTGNFLAEILERKLLVIKSRYAKSQLEYERYSVIAVSSLYGIDILEDNIIECRKRLFNILNSQYISIYKDECKNDCKNAIQYILKKNIIWGDALTLKTVCGDLFPIVFSEWSPVNGSIIKRRDFTMEHLVNTEGSNDNESNLFSDLGENVAIPKPMKDYPAVHFLRLAYIE